MGNARTRIEWGEAFAEELGVIKARRPGDDQGKVEGDLVGLAFSGGGIRSATFGLGVLEALRELGLLKKVDYLSTVSGGGYIGAWLSANCLRAKAREVDWLDPKADWQDSIRHLRRYSNYLSPQVGFFSADTWTIGTVWLRNTMLIQMTVILAIAVVLLLPRPLHGAFELWPAAGDWRWLTIILFILGVVGIAGNLIRLNWNDCPLLKMDTWPWGLSAGVASLAMVGLLLHFTQFKLFPDPLLVDPDLLNPWWPCAPIAVLLVLGGFCLQPVAVKLVNLAWAGKADKPRQVNFTQGWVQGLVALPMMVVAFLVAAILWEMSKCHPVISTFTTYSELFTTTWQYWPFPLWVVFSSLWVLSLCSIRDRASGLGIALLAPFPALLVLHALLCVLMLLLHHFARLDEEGQLHAFVWAPALVLYFLSLSVLMLIGIQGRQSTEGVREWWSRLGAWLGIYGIAWMLIVVAAIYGPLLSAFLTNAATWSTATIGWLATTLAGIFAGKSGVTGGAAAKGMSEKALGWVAKLAPFVFITGLLVGIATVLHLIVAHLSCFDGVGALGANYWALWNNPEPDFTWTMLAVCLIGLLLFGWRVDINEFSFNAFYRSRLVRCYLGATRSGAAGQSARSPQNFTGFDDADDLRLDELSKGPAGPLHIINCALNLGGSSDLELHTRHSAIFTLTPLHCGSSYRWRDKSRTATEMGYIPTAQFGGERGQPTLGQAISVSGAAASPNMGYHTSPAVAFLMTLFNVRLGWWFPNPSRSGVDSPSPGFSLRYLLMELFGAANDKSKFLSISDGGHFENLAAYELIKRKCKVIIISDGECDPKLQFEGLGTLIRMAEVDLDARITIDVESIRLVGESPWSRNRCAVGRIGYDYRNVSGSGGCQEGWLIYLKASMTGHEDTEVMQYKSTHQTFPHETTGDQFYGEDQFESYRSLGWDIAMRTFNPSRKPVDRETGICADTGDSKWTFANLAKKLWSSQGGGREPNKDTG
ncbi:MAG TPA: patatin-like phospholipase family protein [Nitrospira sp.]|nr:patatin-like phospholipase family protein [Nitrospira sp.]